MAEKKSDAELAALRKQQLLETIRRKRLQRAGLTAAFLAAGALWFVVGAYALGVACLLAGGTFLVLYFDATGQFREIQNRRSRSLAPNLSATIGAARGSVSQPPASSKRPS